MSRTHNTIRYNALERKALAHGYSHRKYSIRTGQAVVPMDSCSRFQHH